MMNYETRPNLVFPRYLWAAPAAVAPQRRHPPMKHPIGIAKFLALELTEFFE